MVNDRLKREYCAIRRTAMKAAARNPDSAPGAAHALRLARQRAEAGKPELRPYGPATVWAGLGGCNGPTVRDFGERALRWIEDPAACGLRFVGLAHELADLKHTGWFTDPDGVGDLARGVVYLLPARDGRTRALAAMADPFNADRDGRGPALVSMEIFEADPEAERATWSRLAGPLPALCHGLGAWTEAAGETAIREAAQRADSLAESYAEREREHEEAWREGVRARELAADAYEAGRDCLSVCRALRGLWAVRHGVPALSGPAAREAIRGQIAALRRARDDYAERLDEAREARRSVDTGNEAWRDGYFNGA